MEGRTLPLVLVAACVLLDGDGCILIAKRPPRQIACRALGVPRRQGRAGRVARACAHSRARRGARHRHRGSRSCAAHLRQPRLSRLPPADAALSLPALAGRRSRRMKARSFVWVKPAELASYAMPPADEPLKALLPALLNEVLNPRESSSRAGAVGLVVGFVPFVGPGRLELAKYTAVGLR